MNKLRRDNIAAENQWYREKVYGQKSAAGSEQPSEDDAVGDNLHVGESVTHQHYYQQPSSDSAPSVAKFGISPIAAALLGMAIPVAGGLGALGAYIATRPDPAPTPVVQPFDYDLHLTKPNASGTGPDELVE